MQRRTRNIVLTLVSSTVLFGCCLSSCINARDEEEKDAQGNVVRHQRHYYYRPWFRPFGFFSAGYSSPFYSRTYSGSGRSTAHPGSSYTSRGGFGGTGHSVAGG